jgi:hypothetical protein
MQLRMTPAVLAEEGEDIVLRGLIDPDTLDALRVDNYQREIESRQYIEDIARSFATNAVADIDLGMRGGDFVEEDGAFVLKDPVYIVDGFQRVTAARHAMGEGVRPMLGAALRFNTNYEWEKERFHVLNAKRKRVSPNIHLRNMRSRFPLVELLHELCQDEKGFPLHRHVCWQQSMRRDHLLTATTLLKCVATLHAHFGVARSLPMEELVAALQKVVTRIGAAQFRANVLVFVGVVEDCWAVSRLGCKDQTTAVRGGFLTSLARILDEHDAFWRETRLVVEAPVRRKLKSFPITDGNVQRLAASSGPSALILHQMMLGHLNAGRRTGKLVARDDRKAAVRV